MMGGMIVGTCGTAAVVGGVAGLAIYCAKNIIQILIQTLKKHVIKVLTRKTWLMRLSRYGILSSN
jgi:hypothetical protein